MHRLQQMVIAIIFIIATFSIAYEMFGAYLYFHDKHTIEQHDQKINKKTQEKINKDEQAIQTLNNAIDHSDSTLIDRVLAEQDTTGGARQNGSNEIPEGLPNANPNSTNLSRRETNNGLGLTDKLHPAPLSQYEITELLQAEAQKGEEFCYPEETQNDDGSTGFVETCYPLSEDLIKNMQK